MTVWHSPPEQYLVGDFAWLTPTSIFWFAANGDSGADVHTLEFDQVNREPEGLRFFRRGKCVGLLAPIDRADVDDRDDFRVAWQIWQHIEPLRRAFIESKKWALYGARCA
ncbi:MAG: hypothetical protein RIQ93_3195 [Verrucomicrobiota bacterium]